MSEGPKQVALVVDAGPEVDLPRIRALRYRRLRLAVATSLGAKTASLVLQFAVVPVAFQALGASNFGLFVGVTSLVGWMGVTSVGIGPGLTIGIARSIARGDLEVERSYFWTAGVLISAIAGVIAVVVTIAFVTVPVQFFTGALEPAMANDARASLVIIGLLSASQLLLGVVDSARLGYQELHITNLWTLVSTGLSLVALVGLGASPSVTFLIVALNAPPVAARLLNGLFLMRRHALVRPPRPIFRGALARQIVVPGLGFAGIGVATYLSQQVGLVLLAQRAGPEAVAAPGAMLRLISLAISAVVMLTQPLWPALTDATIRLDPGWAKMAYRRVLLLCLAYSGLVFVALILVGQPAVRIWTGGAVLVDRSMLILFACYFPLNVWSHVHAMTLVGMGRIGLTASVLIGEGLLAVVIVALTMPILGGTSIPFALVASTAAISAWLLPIVTARRLAVALAGARELGRPSS